MMKRLLLIWIIFSAVVSAREQVNIITIDGIINPASSEFISKMIERAETDNANCLIIKLDTPGGLVNAMRDITQDILTAKIPVVVYVSPSGARAGSAGRSVYYLGRACGCHGTGNQYRSSQCGEYRDGIGQCQCNHAKKGNQRCSGFYKKYRSGTRKKRGMGRKGRHRSRFRNCVRSPGTQRY